jgi:hypothetical protein
MPSLKFKKLVEFSKKTAQEVLERLAPTAEDAAKLVGPEREKYLEALTVLHGDQAKRAADLGFDLNNLQYHGTKFNKKAIDEFISSGTKRGDTFKYGKGVYTTPWSGYADQYSDVEGVIYPLALKAKKEFNPADLEAAKKILSDSGIEYKQPRLLRSTEEGLDLIERAVGKKDVSNIIDAQGYRTANADDGIFVSKPEDVRSKFAAFDPRFKDSRLIMAGAAAMPLTDRVSPFSAASDLQESYAENISGPISSYAKDLFNPTKNEYVKQDPVYNFAVDAISDPANYVPGPAGAVVAGVQGMGLLNPRKGLLDKNKVGLISNRPPGWYRPQ